MQSGIRAEVREIVVRIVVSGIALWISLYISKWRGGRATLDFIEDVV